jgi:glycerate kinase
VEHEKEIREAIQAIGRACDRAVESFDRMTAEGGMAVALEAAEDVSAIGVRYQRLHEILQAQAARSIERILNELGIRDQQSDRELEADGNVVTFPGRLN